MYKHYIRINENNEIIHAFSDAFETAQEGDIAIYTGEVRQLLLLGKINPNITNLGVPLYKWVNNEIVEV